MIRMEQITATSGQRPGATLDQPLDHLPACHRRIEERLAILERAADHLEDRRDEALEAIRNCFRFLDTNGVWHTADEEESVFPRLQQEVEEDEAQFLRGLEADHRTVERVYQDLKDRFAAHSAESAGSFREAVAHLCGLYRAHIAAEEASLISIARRVLKESQLLAITREMRVRRGLA
jgi:hemerythrin-like domain-containing protein